MVRPDDIAVLVVSCDRYSDLWGAFFTCWFRYWPDCPFKIYLGSNKATYPDQRVNNISVGPDVSYSDNLRRMLAQVVEPYVIFWVEDRMVSAPVRTTDLLEVINEAVAGGAGYLKLIPQHPLAYGSPGTTGPLPIGTPYRVSMTVALWDRSLLEGLLVTGESAWDIERRGTVRTQEMKNTFWGLTPKVRRNPPIFHVHTIIQGKVCLTAKRFLTREGLWQHFSNRRPEPIVSLLYSAVYHVIFRLVRPVQAFWLSRRGEQ